MIPPNNTLVITPYISTHYGQWTNQLYYVPEDPLTLSSDMQAIADDAFGIFQPHYTTILNAFTIFAGVKCRYYAAAVDLEAYSTADPVNGELDSQDALPDQDCLEVRRLTGLPGRKNRGRIFVSGISEDLQKDGVIDSANYTLVQDFASAFSTDIELGGQMWHARHWNRVDNLLKPIISSRALVRLVSRRDRAKRIPYQVV